MDNNIKSTKQVTQNNVDGTTRTIVCRDVVSYYQNDAGEWYYGIMPRDLNDEPWFNQMIADEGLDNLVKEYPYQPMYIDEDTGLLTPVDRTCPFNARVTNCFHIIYQIRMDKMRRAQAEEIRKQQMQIEQQRAKIMQQEQMKMQQQAQQMQQESNDFNGISIENLFTPDNFVRKPVIPKGVMGVANGKPSDYNMIYDDPYISLEQLGPSLEQAYHMKDEPVQYQDFDFNQLIMSKDDEQKMYSFDTSNGKEKVEVKYPDQHDIPHPNRDQYGRYIQQRGFDNRFYRPNAQMPNIDPMQVQYNQNWFANPNMMWSNPYPYYGSMPNYAAPMGYYQQPQQQPVMPPQPPMGYYGQDPRNPNVYYTPTGKVDVSYIPNYRRS